MLPIIKAASMLLAAVLYLLSGAPVALAGPAGPNLADNFSSDSGLWQTYVGTARRESGDVRLTPGLTNQVGQIWLKQAVSGPFTAEYRFKIVPVQGRTVADGIVFMFYKQSGYAPAYGGTMGFTKAGPDPGVSVPGFGIEIDTYGNSWDSGRIYKYVPHTALIQNSVNNHLAGYAIRKQNIEDGNWHDLKVVVTANANGTNNLEVTLDGTDLFSYNNHTLPQAYGGLGFSAATGAWVSSQYVTNFILNYNFNPYDSSGKPCASFSGSSNNTVVMKAQGLTAGRYQVAYYDANGNKQETDSVTVGADGLLSSRCQFAAFPRSASGNWHAVLYTGFVSPPSHYTGGITDPFLAQAAFYVAPNAIPEFPAAAGALMAIAACGVVYWLMKRRVLGLRCRP
jgi:hypothetical protein